MEFAVAFVLGVLVGALAALAVGWIKKREAKDIAQELLAQTQNEKLADLNAIIDNLKVSFDALSLNALSRNTDQFMKLAQQTLSGQTQAGGKELEGKKQLIDQTLEGMKSELEKVTVRIQTLEKDRENKFGELSAQLKM